ncbi:hypothetical protein [Neisseria sp. Ec49-e6-T10]|uniref:hypothetical protein n=1 Tax=Neisseria sp. Ec49-e6-T10 TaxID=3140744 RepID=UPI003EBF5FBA
MKGWGNAFFLLFSTCFVLSGCTVQAENKAEVSEVILASKESTFFNAEIQPVAASDETQKNLPVPAEVFIQLLAYAEQLNKETKLPQLYQSKDMQWDSFELEGNARNPIIEYKYTLLNVTQGNGGFFIEEVRNMIDSGFQQQVAENRALCEDIMIKTAKKYNIPLNYIYADKQGQQILSFNYYLDNVCN